MEGANTDEVVTSFLVECLPVSLAAAVILVLLAVNWVQPQKTVTLWLFHKPRTFGVFPFLLYRKLLPLLSVAALVAGIGYGAYTLYIPEFIESQLTRSTLFEEAYVDPRSITLTFPEEKRNLVYIYLESMESTYLSKELGGNQEENLLPNLSELALTNLNFSHTDTLGGARQVTGTSWTIAAMVSQTTGVPLKIPVGDNDYGNKSAMFLPGVWSLGDILEQEGYRQELLIGSDASFGGRRQYFAQHGGYNILGLLHREGNRKNRSRLPGLVGIRGFEAVRLCPGRTDSAGRGGRAI